MIHIKFHFITPLNICDAPIHKKAVWNTWELRQRHTPAKGACRLQRKPSQLLSKNSRSLGWRGTFHPLLTYKQVLAAPREQFGCEFLDHMFFFRDLFDVHINDYLLTLNSLKQHFPQTLLPNMWPQIVAFTNAMHIAVPQLTGIMIASASVQRNVQFNASLYCYNPMYAFGAWKQTMHAGKAVNEKIFWVWVSCFSHACCYMVQQLVVVFCNQG